jgi:hypothetical protein
MKLIKRGVEMRLDREHNERAWIVWHVDALRRAKRLPRIERLLAKSKRRGRATQTWQEQHQIMAAWAARVDRAISVRGKL